jgi:hypothetical protein
VCRPYVRIHSLATICGLLKYNHLNEICPSLLCLAGVAVSSRALMGASKFGLLVDIPIFGHVSIVEIDS